MPTSGPKPKLRDQYTWHITPPFSELFDSRPWWCEQGRANIDPVAALYELARRLPRVGELRRKHFNAIWHGQELRPLPDGDDFHEMANVAFAALGQEPAAIHCLCLIGLRSWPTLDLKNQEYWEMSAGKLKGVDCRDSMAQCTALVGESFNDLLHARRRHIKIPNGALHFRVEAKRGGGPLNIVAENPGLAARVADHLAAEVHKNPPKMQEFEDRVARRARDAFREGSFIFALPPDLSYERAIEVFAASYREEQNQAGLVPQRARWDDWLPAVAEFERDERRKSRSKARTFTRYRRIIDGIDLAPKTSRLMQFIAPD